MNFRSLAAAILCTAIPFAISCAESEDFDTSAVTTSGTGPLGGRGTDATGGSAGAVNGTGGISAGGPNIGAAGSSTATTGGNAVAGVSGQATGAIGTGGSATGGTLGTGGSVGATGGRSGATGGTPGATGGTPAATGGSTGATGGTPGSSTGATGGTPGSSTGGTGGKVVGTGGTPGVAGSSGISAAAGTIVPLYTDPTDGSWDAIVTAALAHPTVQVVAIVNPADGPGPSKSQDYVAGIASLQAANIKVIGYVATGYGSHSLASMQAEIDTWKSFYPQVQGIFFDEQSNNPADVAHYQTLSQYAKSKGLAYTVGNPGTDVPAAYIGAVDTMLIYESDGLPALDSLKAWSAYAPSNFGIIPYKASLDPTFVKQARAYVHYIYVTSDDLPNPWDSLTPFFSNLLAALE